MVRVKSTVLKVKQLDYRTKKNMYELFSKYYQNTDQETFFTDLSEKQHVFMFRHSKTNQIVGFSTIYRKSEAVPGVGKVTYIFSGDTVMDRSIWGAKCLQVAFFNYILQTKMARPFSPVYWMLMSKGFKTYMMMRRNFKESFPASQKATTNQADAAARYFYTRKFGRDYDHESSLIKFQSQKDSVKKNYAALPTDEDSDIKYFLERNPRYDQGEELACIAEIRFADFPLHVSKYIFKPVAQLFRRRSAAISGNTDSYAQKASSS